MGCCDILPVANSGSFRKIAASTEGDITESVKKEAAKKKASGTCHRMLFLCANSLFRSQLTSARRVQISMRPQKRGS
jgi:hypothetical protein